MQKKLHRRSVSEPVSSSSTPTADVADAAASGTQSGDKVDEQALDNRHFKRVNEFFHGMQLRRRLRRSEAEGTKSGDEEVSKEDEVTEGTVPETETETAAAEDVSDQDGIARAAHEPKRRDFAVFHQPSATAAPADTTGDTRGDSAPCHHRDSASTSTPALPLSSNHNDDDSKAEQITLPASVYGNPHIRSTTSAKTNTDDNDDNDHHHHRLPCTREVCSICKQGKWLASSSRDLEPHDGTGKLLVGSPSGGGEGEVGGSEFAEHAVFV